ncbi:Aminomethyltransferase (glycine cleavage system T protein) [hydrothermal vent metagenome]|uniref:aminomethyltransferase n=1 Tax=hydrothermal vent metagenome TaxID=652676 RepID=A0A3B1A7M1_9ZZZZ
MGKQTPLYNNHVEASAKVVDFGGWDMPLHYGSQMKEHELVRNSAGIFDVSHMTVVDLSGERVAEFLRYLLANNVDRLKQPGKALYTCMLNEKGGVIDDLIVYFINDTFYRMVVNASTREKDLAWIQKQAAEFNIEINERDDLAMIAVQGPQAREKVHAVIGNKKEKVAELGQFFIAMFDDDWAIARTGYTGEDGYEVMLPNEVAAQFWSDCVAQGVKPAGLGARDTLRLEAGMNLYGSDMDETTTPLESALGWTIAWEPEDRDFIGRSVLVEQKAAGVKRKLVGLLLEGKGVLRNHQPVLIDGLEAGEITSGSYAPSLGTAIAFARVSANIGERAKVDIRGKQVDVRVVKPPFVRNGKAVV